MRRRLRAILLAVFVAAAAVSASGCSSTPLKYEHRFFGAFDTYITLTAYAGSKTEFDAAAAAVEAEFLRLHRLYDKYHQYEGINNVATLNERAADGPVVVDEDLISLMLFALSMQEQYEGTVNIALGGVIDLWHDARELANSQPDLAKIPDIESLEAAAASSNAKNIVIDEAEMTVYFADPELSIDLGAVAKGYAVELAARVFKARGIESYIINAGGNVLTGAPPPDGSGGWRIGIESPDGGGILRIIRLSGRAVVTSGDYQRYFELDGVRYHHIIDPQTLYPSTNAVAVTVVAESSARADFLSTALMLELYEDGRAAIEEMGGIEALWVLPGGEVMDTGGFHALLDG